MKIQELLSKCSNVKQLKDLNYSIETSWGKISPKLSSWTSITLDGLIHECNSHTAVWIYSIEVLPASGHLMMRYVWVD